MNNRNIIGIAIALSILIVAISFAVYVIPSTGKVIAVPATVTQETIKTVKGWGDETIAAIKSWGDLRVAGIGFELRDAGFEFRHAAG